MLVTPHFDSVEFDQPAGHGLSALPYPEGWVEDRLRPLCHALEVVRAALGGSPVRVTSGYRSAGYNAAIGGARASQHMRGRAADIKVSGFSAAEIHDRILALYREQAILIGGLGSYPTFTHLDVREGARLARWSGGRTIEG